MPGSSNLSLIGNQRDHSLGELKHSMRRLRATALASAVGQLLAVANQLVVLPLALLFWGQSRYGEWLVLSAMPVFLTWAEFGIGTAAANQVCLELAAGREEEAQRVMTASVSCFFYGCLIVGAGWLVAVPMAGVFLGGKFHILSIQEVRWALALLGPYALVGLMQWPLLTVFRANGVNHIGVMVSNGTRFADLTIGIAAIMISKSVVIVAGSLLISRLFGTLAIICIGRPYSTNGIRIRLGGFDWPVIRSIMPSSLTFALSNINSALQIQVTTMAVGLTLGSTAVVMFTALRTVSRIPTQLAGLISASLWPEMTRALGANRITVARALAGFAFRYSLIVIALSFLIIVPSGPRFVHLWTHGNVQLSAGIIAFYMLAMSVNQINGVAFTILAAVNQQRRLALAQTAVYLLVGATIWIEATHLEVIGIVALTLIGELVILGFAPHELARILQIGVGKALSLAFNRHRPMPAE